jgi:hypothetical protein
MKPFTLYELQSLRAPHSAPCISLLLPTHRRSPDADQDPLRFKNLLETAEDLLRRRYTPQDVRALLEPVGILSNSDFWRYLGALSSNGCWRTQIAGLAVFRSPDFTGYYQIPVRLPEVAVVADTFHVKPLIQFLQSNRRFFVLALSQKNVALYEGTPYSLGRVELLDLPASFTEALGSDRKESFLNLHSPSANSAAPIFHGHGGVAQNKKETLVRFFRVIDNALWRLLREERAPLVLVGVGYYHPIYHTLSRYPHLTEHGVEGNFEHAMPQEIHTRVWPIVSAWFQAREDQVLNEYTRLAGREQVRDDLQRVAQAAVHGQGRRLLVEEHVHLWGMLDCENGKVVQHATQQDTRDGDVLNDLTACVLARGGEVLTVQAARMPSRSPVAAILRW